MATVPLSIIIALAHRLGFVPVSKSQGGRDHRRLDL